MKIVCYGDSNTWGYDPRSWFGERYERIWTELLAKETGFTVVNQGENGREIPNYPVEFPPDTDLLILMLGTNDLLQGAGAAQASGKMEAFLMGLNLSRDRVLLVAPPAMTLGEWVPDVHLPDASKELARHYRALAERLGLRFTDAGEWGTGLAFDGVHFTQEGHHTFAREIINCVKKFTAS